jgi:hypothetical protein
MNVSDVDDLGGSFAMSAGWSAGLTLPVVISAKRAYKKSVEMQRSIWNARSVGAV